MKDIKLILNVIKSINERLKSLESIGIPKDGKTPIKGVDYFDGKDGRDGKDGLDGKDGAPGRDGVDGKDFTFDMFTPEQLFMLKGKDGKDGPPGKDGIDGKPGKDGRPGKDGKDGKQGVKGKDGKNGKDGKDGKDGRGIDNVYIDDEGHLIIVFTDGEKKDVGRVVGEDGLNGFGVVGPQGKPGVGIKEVSVDEEGHLLVTLTDGRVIDAGFIGGGGTGTGNVSSETITNIWCGSQKDYDSLPSYSETTLYFIEG